MRKHQRGQIIVFLLVLIAILVTVLLSISTRTLQQLKTSSTQERSSRAFTAAEAAVEAALKQDLDDIIAAGGTGSIGGLGSGIESAEYSVAEVDDFIVDLDQDDVAQIDLSDWTTFGGYDGTITVCWEEEGSGDDPSLELTFFEDDAGSVSLVRYAYNAVGASRDNGFDAADSPVGGGGCDGYENEKLVDPDLTNDANATYLRIKTWYALTNLKVLGVAPQVYNVEGEAEALGGEQRKVRTQVYPAKWPPVFDFVIFDGSGDALKK